MTGMTMRLSSVDIITPPITTIAIGCRKLEVATRQAESDGKHAGCHGDGGHDDRPGALVAGVYEGIEPRHALSGAT